MTVTAQWANLVGTPMLWDVRERFAKRLRFGALRFRTRLNVCLLLGVGIVLKATISATVSGMVQVAWA
jgi:hypothetical protein